MRKLLKLNSSLISTEIKEMLKKGFLTLNEFKALSDIEKKALNRMPFCTRKGSGNDVRYYLSNVYLFNFNSLEECTSREEKCVFLLLTGYNNQQIITLLGVNKSVISYTKKFYCI